VLLLQFTRYGYLMTLPYRSAFTEIDEHVYINKDYAGDRQELMEMIGQAKDRVNNFFGGLSFQDNTIFIIYDDENLRQKIGEDHAAIIFSFPCEGLYFRQKPSPYSGTDEWGLTQSGKKAKCSFYDTFAISPSGSPVQESCTPGSTGGVPREGHVYQPKPHARICEGLRA